MVNRWPQCAPLHDAVGTKLVDLDTSITGTEFGIPTGVILTDEIEHIGLELAPHILHPRIGWEPAQRARKSRHQHDFIFCFWNLATLDIDSTVHDAQGI